MPRPWHNLGTMIRYFLTSVMRTSNLLTDRCMTLPTRALINTSADLSLIAHSCRVFEGEKRETFRLQVDKVPVAISCVAGRCGGAAVPEAGARGRPQQLGILHLNPQRDAQTWQVRLPYLFAVSLSSPSLLHLPLTSCKMIEQVLVTGIAECWLKNKTACEVLGCALCLVLKCSNVYWPDTFLRCNFFTPHTQHEAAIPNPSHAGGTWWRS